MAEYIDIDAPIDFAVYERNRRITATLRQLLEINDAKYQTAGVRPVVLCKDCKHSAIDLENMRYCKCVVYYNHVSDDWFCADGEKREES